MVTQNINFNNENAFSHLGEIILTVFSWLNAEGISWKERNKLAERPGGFAEAVSLSCPGKDKELLNKSDGRDDSSRG